ncbi:MAG: hypothetical protein AB7O97_12835 [Planctomycetota bacterium]
MNNLFVRLLVYVPVLFLIAIVVVGQSHVSARETVRDALRRTVRWLAYTGIIVVAMLAIEWLFID